jgi:hypothetical protein
MCIKPVHGCLGVPAMVCFCALEGYQLTVNSELARFRESDCLIKTKHCDGPRGC